MQTASSGSAVKDPQENEMQIWFNGEFVTRENAKVSVFDHGLLYGDGCFEGIRIYNRNIFRLKEHIERLYDSMKYLMLTVKLSQQEMVDATIEACAKNNLDNGYIRLLVTRGEGTLGISPFTCNDPNVIIIVSDISLYPKEYYTKGLDIITAATRRNSPAAVSPRVKSLNYLNNILAKIEAKNANVLEALMLDNNGYIVECTADNFFLLKNGVLYTPPTYQGALRGVTRDAVIELAKESGIEVREERLTLYEAYTADESFLTGTAAEVMPLISIDARPIGNGKPGEITMELNRKFRELTVKDGEKF